VSTQGRRLLLRILYRWPDRKGIGHWCARL